MTFKRAERKQAKLRLGLCGPSGSGKTYSALKIAFGLGGKIALIDTEAHSGELYADLGDYSVAVIDPPYDPARYVELINEASAAFDVVIVDSLSHAWAGEGGLLDQHSTYSKTTGNSYTAWREVTPKHNKLIDAMLHSRAHIIATMRTKQDYVLEQNDKGKQVPKKVGMAPVQREGMDYEFTVVFDLTLSHHATVSKDRTSLFDGRAPFQPNEATGAALLEWLTIGKDPVAESGLAMEAMLERMTQCKHLKELDNWGKKHAGEINTLLPEHKAQITDKYKAIRALLTEDKGDA